MFDRHLPAVIWAQRNDKLYVTINVEDCQNAVVNFDDSKLTFRYFISSGCLFGYCWILLLLMYCLLNCAYCWWQTDFTEDQYFASFWHAVLRVHNS